MSYFVAVDGKPVADIATNSGWFDFAHWLRGLGVDVLTHLADEGYSEEIQKLGEAISDAADNDDPTDDQRSIADGFLEIIASLSDDAFILIVTDGFDS